MNSKPNKTLKLQAHSIRTLTPSDLRVVNGGCHSTSTQGGGADRLSQ